jgi:hypothetical protein
MKKLQAPVLYMKNKANIRRDLYYFCGMFKKKKQLFKINKSFRECTASTNMNLKISPFPVMKNIKKIGITTY